MFYYSFAAVIIVSVFAIGYMVGHERGHRAAHAKAIKRQSTLAKSARHELKSGYGQLRLVEKKERNNENHT